MVKYVVGVPGEMYTKYNVSLLSLWLTTRHVVALCEFIATQKVIVYAGKELPLPETVV